MSIIDECVPLQHIDAPIFPIKLEVDLFSKAMAAGL